MIRVRILHGILVVTALGAVAACGGGKDGGGTGPVVATSIAVTPTSANLTDCGQTTLQVAAYDNQGHPVTGVVISFGSSDAAVASVNSGGVVTGHGAGSAYIRATAGSLADSAHVTVADSQTVTMLDRFSDLAVGGKDTLHVVVRDCRGTLRASPTLTFTPVPAGIVTATPQGEITAVAGGQAFVRVTVGGSADSSDIAVFTHPVGVLGTPTTINGSPYGIAVRRTGEVVVALLNAGAVGVMPAAGGSSTSFLTGAFPTDVATSLDGLTGAVANQGDGLGRLDLVGRSQVALVTTPFNPFRVLRSRDGARYFVGGNGTEVRAYDAATGAFITSYAVEKDQNGLAESPDRAFLYASSMFGGVVREITLATGVVGRSFTIGGTPQEVVVSADGSELFVANEASSYIGIWNLASGAKVDSVAIGAVSFGMALSPDGARLYVGSTSTGKIYIVNPTTRVVLDSIPTGGLPRRIAFNRAGTKAYVASESGWVDQIQ